MWITDILIHQGPVLCERALPSTEFNNLYNALVCGANLPAGSDKQLFIDTGLIHLMVVSGSHLVFIETLLVFLPRTWRLCVMGFYCFITGFQAPVVRAFLRRLVQPTLRLRSGLTALQIEAFTVILILFTYPPWLVSRSFLMSWMCGLALCAPVIFPRWRHLDLALKAYVFLFPFCWVSPITVGWNTLLAPFVGILLFPACLVVMLIPAFTPATDLLWRGFLGLLALGPQTIPLEVFLSASQLCWIPLVTHVSLLVLEVRWRRAHAFSCSFP